MKTNFFIAAVCVILFSSCEQKEMKISQSDYSVVTELNDVSPAYILKNDEGKVELKKNSLIGNTHWVLSVERNLTLEDIAPSLQKLTEKKFKVGGMHEDSKDIYLVYSDTVHKQNAYVKIPFTSIAIDEPTVYELAAGVQSLHLSTIDDAKSVSNSNAVHTYLLSLDKKMSTATFVNILIELEKKQIAKNINGEVYVY